MYGYQYQPLLQFLLKSYMMVSVYGFVYCKQDKPKEPLRCFIVGPD